MDFVQLFNKFKANFLIIGLCLIFFSSLYSQSNIGAQGLFLPFNVVIWLAVGFFVSFTFFNIVYKGEFYFSLFNKILSIFLIIIFFISTLNSNLPFNDLLIFGLAFLGVITFFIALEQYQIKKKDLITLLYFLCLVGFFQALISLFQIHDSEFWLFINVIAYAPLTIFEGVPLGSFQQVNMLATFLAFNLVAILFLILQNDIKSKPFIHPLLLMLLASLLAYVIALSGSRASLLVLFSGLILLVVASFRQLKTQFMMVFFWVVFIVIGMYLAYLFPGETPGLLSVESKVSKTLIGGDARLLIYSLGWEQFLNSPWIGNGLGNYTQNLMDVASKVGVAENFKGVDLSTFKHPHNEFLFWLINAGFVVFVGVVVLSVLYIKNLVKLPAKYGLVIFSFAIMFIIPAMLSYPFTLSALHLVLLLVFMQVGNQSSSRVVKFNNKNKVFYFLYAFIFAVFVIVFYSAWHTLVSTKEVIYFNDRALHQTLKTKEEALNTIYLEHAAVNPLYKVQAKQAMNEMIKKSLSSENVLDILQFVHWANRTQIYLMDSESAVNLIKCYIFLKQPDKAVQTYKITKNKFKGDEQYRALESFMIRAGLLPR